MPCYYKNMYNCIISQFGTLREQSRKWQTPFLSCKENKVNKLRNHAPLF